MANEKEKETITLSETNNWKHKFNNLPLEENGTEIKYTIKEKNIPQGYTTEVKENEKNNFTITNTHIPEQKIFDLALRKYITEINNNKLETLNQQKRVPEISEKTLQTGTTATYKHIKQPVEVETNDIVTYAITIYNEGEKSGYANQIIDQLPTGLIYNPNSTITSKDKNGQDKNKYKVTYDTTSNKITFDLINSNENPATDLKPYIQGNIDKETIYIKCKVIFEPKIEQSNILTNTAWINKAYDTEDKQEAKDRDSEPETRPEVNKDNMEKYKGNTENKEDLSDKDYYYKGEQDDDDFEKEAEIKKR